MQILEQSFDYSDTKEFNFGFMSDLHLEAHDHNRKKLIDDLNLLKATNSHLYIGGDVFDMILPGDRKRYVKSNDISESQNVINEVVAKATDLLKPYVNIIDGIAVGNHETSVIKYHSVDPTLWLIKELNHLRDPKLPPIMHMGYSGYIIHNYHQKDSAVRRLKIWYHHGCGGSSVVTKGMIDFNRAVYGNDADIYVMGHKHVSTIDAGIERLYLDKNNNPVVKTLKGFYVAGYKGGHIHKQVGTYGFNSDYSTEKFLNHSSSGMVRMKTLIVNHEVLTELTTGRC